MMQKHAASGALMKEHVRSWTRLQFASLIRLNMAAVDEAAQLNLEWNIQNKLYSNDKNLWLK